jgi:hypothetical protein
MSLKAQAPLMLLPPPLLTTTMSPAITRDQISAWKCYFEGRVVISSASGMERGEVFCGLMDWLGSCDPMTHRSGLDD